MTAERSRRPGDVLFFQNANRSWILIGCIDQDSPAHGVGGFASVDFIVGTYNRAQYTA